MAIAILVFANSPAVATEIWLTGGGDPNARWHRPDFMALFQPDAQWSGAARHVSVFKTTSAFLAKAPESQLQTFLGDLRLRGIKLAVEIGLLHGDGSGCGRGMEGFAAMGEAAAIAQRVKNLGGEVNYVAIDEPLWYGHRARGNRACEWSVQKVASIVADAATKLWGIFPNLQIGDIEPVGGGVEFWPQEIELWTAAYRLATGRRLAFLHADIQWETNWRPALTAVAQSAHASGIQFGIIINGNTRSKTSIEWTATAEQRYRALIRDSSVRIDQVVFQSWDNLPERFLPDTDPSTLTGLVRQSLH